MSSPIDEVAALCARTYRTSSLVLRGTPAAAGWLLGWLSAEFAPHVLTGHALSAVPSPLARLATGLAVQRADSVLTDVLQRHLRAGTTSRRFTIPARPTPRASRALSG